MRKDKKQHSHQLSHQTLRFVEDFAEVLRSVTHLWLEQNQKTHITSIPPPLAFTHSSDYYYISHWNTVWPLWLQMNFRKTDGAFNYCCET